MGWYAHWLMVAWGPAVQVEAFKHAFKTAWRFYPDGDMGAWERVGINLRMPDWTLQNIFRLSEEADAREAGEEIAPRKDEFIFIRPKSTTSMVSLKQLTCHRVAKFISEGNTTIISALGTLPDEVKCDIVQLLSLKAIKTLRENSETSKIFRGIIPDEPIEAQLIYDLSLNKGYLLHDLKQQSVGFPDVVIDVAYWVEPSSSMGHSEISGGGELLYSLNEDEDTIVGSLSYRHDFYVSPEGDEAEVSPLAGWSEFTREDCAESYKFRYDEMTPMMGGPRTL